RLPSRGRPERVHLPAARKIGSEGGLAMRILLVDDSRLVRTLIKVNLMGNGMEFIEPSDGEQALQLLTGEGFDLIISDLEMPNLNGIELVKKVRAHARRALRSIPIILLSGSQPAERWRQSALEAGANEFLEKPVSGAGLVAFIRRHVPA